MKAFGLEIRKAVPVMTTVSDNRGGWWPVVREAFAGAWQRNIEWTNETTLAHHAVYACITLISSDIGKLRPKLVQQDANGIWQEITSPAFNPVLYRPNAYQNYIQFKECWINSKLIRGNAYILKERDGRGVVRALYPLDPSRVTVMVAPDGSVFYQLQADNLSGLEQGVTVPASEIIHDRMNCLFHPLVGVTPIYACGQAATVGLHIERNAAHFFGKGSNPSGTITAPTTITQEQADKLAAQWNANYSGENSGKVAIMGNGMTFTPMRMSAVDSQMIEHLKWTAETVCSAFHVPAFKIGAGARDAVMNSEILNQIYYSDCLQYHIEAMELLLDEGLALDQVQGKTMGVELDLDGLIRMDSGAQMEVLTKGVGGSVFKVNEARKKLDLPPVQGGEEIWMQQQNFSLPALARRDAKEDPFASATPARRSTDNAPLAPPEPTPPPKSFDFALALKHIDERIEQKRIAA